MGFPVGRVTEASTDMVHSLHPSGETSNKISISLRNQVLSGLFSGDGAIVSTTVDDSKEK